MYNRQLDTFLQAADSKSLTRASEKLFISTVAVMKQINALEERIGVRLLDRTSQGVTLTSAGRSVYQDAKEIIRMSEQAVYRAKEIAQSERRTVRIGNSRLHPYTAMYGKLSELDLARLPFHIKIVPFLEENVGLDSKLRMLGQEFDCFISPYDERLWAGEYSVLHLNSVPCRLALPRGHRLAGKSLISPEDLHGEALLFHQRGVFSDFDALRDRLETEHPEIRLIDMPIYDTGAFNICAEKNYLMMTLDIWEQIHPSLVTRPVDWDCEVHLGMIYAKNPSKEMLEFAEYLR